MKTWKALGIAAAVGASFTTHAIAQTSAPPAMTQPSAKFGTDALPYPSPIDPSQLSQHEQEAMSAAEKTAGMIRKDETEAKSRRAAVRYLGTIDANRWHEVEDALISALREDKNESVRWEAAMALSHGACSKRILKSLTVVVTQSAEDGNPRETSTYVIDAAKYALKHCLEHRDTAIDSGSPMIRSADATKVDAKAPVKLTAYDVKVQQTSMASVVEQAQAALGTSSMASSSVMSAGSGTVVYFGNASSQPTMRERMKRFMPDVLKRNEPSTYQVTTMPSTPSTPRDTYVRTDMAMPSTTMVTNQPAPVIKTAAAMTTPSTVTTSPSMPSTEMPKLTTTTSPMPKPMDAPPARVIIPPVTRPVPPSAPAAMETTHVPVVEARKSATPAVEMPVSSKTIIPPLSRTVPSAAPITPSMPAATQAPTTMRPVVAAGWRNGMESEKPLIASPTTSAPVMQASLSLEKTVTVTVRTTADRVVQYLQDDTYSRLREYAVDGFKPTDNESVHKVLPAVMKSGREDASPKVRAACARCLGRMGTSTPDVTGTLDAMKNDGDAIVRRDAILALSKLQLARKAASAEENLPSHN